jgi:hypothetical protein
VKSPRYAMGIYLPVSLSTLAHSPVSFGDFVRCPNPATIRASRLVNLGPKALGKRSPSRSFGARYAAISTPSAIDVALPGIKQLATELAVSLNLIRHGAPIKGDTRYLGRFLLREPAHKITGAINEESPQRYGFPQHPQYSTVWAGMQ